MLPGKACFAIRRYNLLSNYSAGSSDISQDWLTPWRDVAHWPECLERTFGPIGIRAAATVRNLPGGEKNIGLAYFFWLEKVFFDEFCCSLLHLSRFRQNASKYKWGQKVFLFCIMQVICVKCSCRACCLKSLVWNMTACIIWKFYCSNFINLM